VTFGCLSSELAAVLQGLAESPNGFLVKAIHVEPAAEAGAVPGTNPGSPLPGPNNPPPGGPVRQRPPGGPNQPPPANRPPPTVTPTVQRGGAADKPILLLKERRLKVTLLIYAIKAVK
jgi:hypothetical protein